MDIQSENTALSIEIQKRWLSASRNFSGRSFDDPMLGDEFFNDQRDRASLEARGAGQIGTRNRLLGANLVEDEISVDLTCDSIRRAQIAVHKETRRWHILLPPPTQSGLQINPIDYQLKHEDGIGEHSRKAILQRITAQLLLRLERGRRNGLSSSQLTPSARQLHTPHSEFTHP
jgi:hypothetical protein